MPAKTYVYLQGKCKWCRHRTPETDPFGNTKWSIELYPTSESLAIIKDLLMQKDGVLGIKNVLRKDEDGYSMRFARPQSRLYKGQTVAFPPPEARDKAGMPMAEANIGNGSDVTLKLEVYKHNTPTGKKAKALRWEAIQVDNLNPYEPNRDYTKKENIAFDGMDKVPVQTPDF